MMNYAQSWEGNQAQGAAEDPILIQIAKMLDFQHERLTNLVTRADELAARVLGASPPAPAAATSPTPVPNGLLDKIQMGQAEINIILNRFEDYFGRLERIG